VTLTYQAQVDLNFEGFLVNTATITSAAEQLTRSAAVEISPPLTATFNMPIDPTSISTRTFTVRGAQTGVYAGSYLSGSNVVAFDHPTPFKPGEEIVVNLSDGLRSTEGATLTQPYAWGFRAAVGGGSGMFVDSGQRLGNQGVGSRGVALGDLDGDDDLDAFVGNYNEGASRANKVWFRDYFQTASKIIKNYTILVQFNDETEQVIDFEPVLYGEMWCPLRNLKIFRRVEFDPIAHTLTWPNGLPRSGEK